jgi:hypothetical protein
MNKSLVPQRKITGKHNNLKGVSSQSRRIYVPMFNVAGGGNIARIGEGYYHVLPCGALAHKFFGTPSEGRTHFHLNKNRKNHQIINPRLSNG